MKLCEERGGRTSYKPLGFRQRHSSGRKQLGLSTQSDNSKLPRFYPTSFVNPYSNTSIFRIDVLLTNSVLDEDFFSH